jgi:hypothetical protein
MKKLVKKGGTKKYAAGGEKSGPSLIDKVSLAAKRVSRNISNRNAVRLWNKADKYNSSSPKWNSVYDKGDAAYDKAVEKNKEIAKFKKEKGFQRGGDGTMMGEKFTKMGKLWSKYQSGGTKSTKKYELGGMTGMDWPWKPKKKYASDNARKRKGKKPKCIGNQCV